MPDFLLRDLPEDLMDALRDRAERNARSLQSEIRSTLADSVRMPWDRWAAAAADIRSRTSPDGPTAAELIAAGHAERDAAVERALADEDRDPLLP
ncbi:MAG: Arc family DNA-binding protein [Coriobacteriia bacterium]|nr:Arc family DNA-binding protein [Coriobacteriia bacterium]